MVDAFAIDSTDFMERLRKLSELQDKKLSVNAWKAGKEAMFAMAKATPVAKSFKAYQLRDRSGNPVLNRSGKMIFVKSPQKYDKGMKGQREGYASSTTGRRASKIPKGKRFLLSSWYTARMGFKIRTGKVKAGAISHGEFFSGVSKDRAELSFANTVPYSGNADQRSSISAAAIAGIDAWLTKATQAELDKAMA